MKSAIFFTNGKRKSLLPYRDHLDTAFWDVTAQRKSNRGLPVLTIIINSNEPWKQWNRIKCLSRMLRPTKSCVFRGLLSVSIWLVLGPLWRNTVKQLGKSFAQYFCAIDDFRYAVFNLRSCIVERFSKRFQNSAGRDKIASEGWLVVWI